jgi:ribosomal RNA-processing protein 1
VPPGLSYHLSEIWLTELEKASAIASVQNPVPLKPVLAPFLTFAAKTQSKVAYQQIQTNLIDPLLSALSPPPSLADQPPPPKRLKTSSTQDDLPNLLANSCLSPQDGPSERSQLRKGVLEYIFEVASQEDSRDSNRKRLYAICNANIDEDDDA